MFRVRYTETANRCFLPLTHAQRHSIIRIVANLQVDPAVDNWVKFTLYELGAMYTIYLDHQSHWVVDHMVDNDLIEVVSLGVGGPYVPLETD